MKQKPGPGFFWLFFYGRRRRGFPWLLVGVLGLAIALGATFALPHGADFAALAGVGFIVAIATLAIASVAIALAGSVRPRGKR